ncbi:MAG TPA: hypothetical protein VJT75_14570 [Thermoleophilaceae bacterium]|nr:hypothetical protein [Thermoleophilaceae bacterium]
MGRRPVRSLLRNCVLSVALLLALAPAASAGDIDDYAYDHAHGCRKHPQPGMLAMERWLEHHAKGESWGIMRCEKLSGDSYSLHAEGRALDWRLNAHDSSERREAQRLIRLFLKRDRHGNNHARARRMGIQELIFNCRSWWAGDGGMEPYSACEHGHVDDSTAHRNHIHIGLNWRGARMKTTFWRGRR